MSYYVSRIEEGRRQGCYILNDEGTRTYDTRVVSAVADLEPGTVLAEVANGAATVTVQQVAGANKGVLTLAGTPSDANAPEGVYTVVCTEPAANGGTFEVERPDGTLDGIATVGVAYDGSVNFTLADGTSDFVAGDVARVTVSYAAGSATLVPAGVGILDGSQKLAGILDAPIRGQGNGATARVAVCAREAEVLDAELVYPTGANSGETAELKETIREALAASPFGIIVRS